MTHWVEVSPILLTVTGLGCAALTLAWTRRALARLPEPGDDVYLDLGRARTPRALLVQAGIGGVLAVLTTARIGLHPVLAGYLYLAISAAPLAGTDLTVRRLPRRIIWPGLLILFASMAAQSLTAHHFVSLTRAAVAGAVATMVFFAVAVATHEPAWGSGDILLTGWVATALGWLGVRQVLAGILIAFLLAVAAIATRRLGGHPAHLIALGPFLMAGPFVIILI